MPVSCLSAAKSDLQDQRSTDIASMWTGDTGPRFLAHSSELVGNSADPLVFCLGLMSAETVAEVVKTFGIQVPVETLDQFRYLEPGSAGTLDFIEFTLRTDRT